MNKRRLWITVLFGSTLGLAAAYISVGYVRSAQTDALPVIGARSQVVLAVRDMPLGSVVKKEDVKLVDWPTEALPIGYASRPEEVVGLGVITAVAANEPLLKAKLASKEEGGGLPIVIPEGQRAMSVKVDEVIGVAGFVVPGTRVDVIATVPSPDNRQEKASRLIIQNVRTLASGQTITRDAEGKPITTTVITLLVDPEQAESLALAAAEGRIQLALRNTLDGDSVRTGGIRAANLLGAIRSAPPSGVRNTARSTTRRSTAAATTPPEDRQAVVEVYRGGVRTLKTF